MTNGEKLLNKWNEEIQKDTHAREQFSIKLVSEVDGIISIQVMCIKDSVHDIPHKFKIENGKTYFYLDNEWEHLDFLDIKE